MSARRRRGGSESDQVPLIIATDRSDGYDKHGGKLKPYSNGTRREFDSTLSDKNNMAARFTDIRDRTKEFRRHIEIQQSKSTKMAGIVRSPVQSSFEGHFEFMKEAQVIGGKIASTYEHLETLTNLAQKKDTFADRPEEIDKLTSKIKGNLSELHKEISHLQNVAQQQRKKHQTKNLLSHSSNMALSLQSKLAAMSSEFKEALEVRTKNLKEQHSRREMYSESRITHYSSRLMAVQADEDTAINMDTTPLLQSQLGPVHSEERYLQARASTMGNIESTIVELGKMFQDLATTIQEQGEMVGLIDSNVESAANDVEGAHSEILRYFQSVTSNRWLMIKIFGVLIFFFVFFVVFMT